MIYKVVTMGEPDPNNGKTCRIITRLSPYAMTAGKYITNASEVIFDGETELVAIPVESRLHETIEEAWAYHFKLGGDFLGGPISKVTIFDPEYIQI